MPGKDFVERQRDGNAIKICARAENMRGGLANVSKRNPHLTLGKLGQHFIHGDVDREVANRLHAHALAEFRSEIIQNRLQRNRNPRSHSRALRVKIRVGLRRWSPRPEQRRGSRPPHSDFNGRRHQRHRFRDDRGIFAAVTRYQLDSSPRRNKPFR
jgi:hypothetical protein